ncbi:hypothetical protein AX16_003536 [Volvariella volvacea WC 439]|nr:hypothetical protein AX16_003536 [Volvariella volvacea WC 439]
MPNKQSRHSTSSSSPTPHSSTKLPKFLHKQNRDRSKSLSDPAASSNQSTTSLGSGSSASHDPPKSPSPSKHSRKSKFLSMKDKGKAAEPQPDDTKEASTNNEEGGDEQLEENHEQPPITIETKAVAIPRPRTRSERPVSAADLPQQHSLYSTSPSPRSPSSTRLGERLSGWFSSAFSSSSNDLTLPVILTNVASSPRSKQSTASALAGVAQTGRRALKIFNHILDSDATPDKCPDPIWILGVQHPGWEPPPPVASSRSSVSGKNKNSFRSSTSSSILSSANSSELSLSQSQLSTVTSGSVTPTTSKHPGASWPPVFYADFTSRIWLTYRSQFPPIKDTRLSELPETPAEAAAQLAAAAATPNAPSMRTRFWGGGERGWTSDSGWGCMLRTGQTLLANALVNIYLGREWRRPPYPVHTADYATYVQIVTWFLDTPSPEAPFSVHRMALAGKELGTDVGQWFGPSVAAGAIKRLVQSFPECGLGVAVAQDNTMYRSDVYLASHGKHSSVRSTKKHGKTVWGDQPVLLLFGIRLGINGVNPIYYDTVKQLYTFPQSVGIAGGRPSSSYYFVGSQADNLFYLDPHHARPAVPLRPAPVVPNHENPHHPLHIPLHHIADLRNQSPPPAHHAQKRHSSYHRETTPESDKDWVHSSPHLANNTTTRRSPKSRNHSHHHRSPTSPSSIRTGSSTFSYHAPISPSPLQKEFSTDSTASSNFNSATSSVSIVGINDGNASGSVSGSSLNDWESENSSVGTGGGGGTGSDGRQGESASPPPVRPHSKLSAKERRRLSASQPNSPGGYSDAEGTGHAPGLNRAYSESLNGGGDSSIASSSVTGSSSLGVVGEGSEGVTLDPIQEHYLRAYTQGELGTFHCDRVRKMPMSGLDPSMLVGFLVRDEADWLDFKRRIAELPKSVFFFQDEPPSWPSDSDDNMGLESICEPDDLDIDMDDDEEGLEVPGSDSEDDEDEEGHGRHRGRYKHRQDEDGEFDEEDEEEEYRHRDRRRRGGDEDDEDLDEEQYYDTRSAGSISPSASSQGGVAGGAGAHTGKKRESRSEDDNTEEDPVEAVTPGPHTTRFEVQPPTPQQEHYRGKVKSGGDEEGAGVTVGGDIEDDWVDPSCPTPPSPSTPPPAQSEAHGQEQERRASLEPPPQIMVTKSSSSGRKKKKRTGSGSASGGDGGAAVPMI